MEEAVWRIEVKDFPAFIVTDDKGNDFFRINLTFSGRLLVLVHHKPSPKSEQCDKLGCLHLITDEYNPNFPHKLYQHQPCSNCRSFSLLTAATEQVAARYKRQLTRNISDFLQELSPQTPHALSNAFGASRTFCPCCREQAA